jgi:DNA-binding PadR family transcriptional regulator
VIKEKLRDGEVKILRALARASHGLPFGGIKEEARLSNPVISDYLKRLQKEGYVSKNVETRRYVITPKGRSELKKLEGIELQTSSASFTTFSPCAVAIPMPNPTRLWIKSFPTPFTDEKVVIDGYLSVDNQHRDKIESALEELRKEHALDWIANFFNDLGEVLSKKHSGYHESTGIMEKPRPLKDRINEGRAKLDFEASLLVVFNGKEVAEKIEWQDWLKKADTREKQDEVERKLLKETIEESKQHRRAWLENLIIQYLSSPLRTRSPREEARDSASSPVELETNLIRQITSLRSMIPKDTTMGELYEIMETLKMEGALKLVTKTEYFFEVDEEKMSTREKENFELFRWIYETLR